MELAGFYGKTADEVKEILNKYNLEAASAHYEYEMFLTDGQKCIEDLKEIGVKYVVIPLMANDKQKGHDKYEQTVKEIIYVSDILKENGIQLLYHNHDYEFEKFKDKIYLECLLRKLKTTCRILK